VDRFCDDFFCTAVAVHLRRINQAYAKLDSQTQRSDFFGTRVPAFAHAPTALAKRWNTRAIGQDDCSHIIESSLETRNAGKNLLIRTFAFLRPLQLRKTGTEGSAEI
jgi:hypothetical protein